MRPFLRFATYFYLMVAILVGIPASGNRAVLCVAPNGHLTIEMENGHCVGNPSHLTRSSEDAGPQMTAACCGDCVDVPVGTHVLSETHGRGRGVGPQTSLPAPLLTAALYADSPAVALGAHSASGAGLPSASAPSRTTILRN